MDIYFKAQNFTLLDHTKGLFNDSMSTYDILNMWVHKMKITNNLFIYLF